jgi:hypothetical protein
MNISALTLAGILLFQPIGCTMTETKPIQNKTKPVYLSAPSERYKNSMLLKCSDEAKKLAFEIYSQGYGEENALLAYRYALESCSLKENLFI